MADRKHAQRDRCGSEQGLYITYVYRGLAQRVEHDAILTAGMDVKNIQVNPKMMASVKLSHAAYKAGLLAKQQKENGEQLKLKEEKKRKALTSSLQQRKKFELQEMRAVTTEIDEQIAEL